MLGVLGHFDFMLRVIWSKLFQKNQDEISEPTVK